MNEGQKMDYFTLFSFVKNLKDKIPEKNDIQNNINKEINPIT